MADDLAKRLVAEWLDEQEGFASRRERMTEEISARPEAWLEAACRVGITALQAQNRKLVEALKQRDGGAHDEDCRIFQTWREPGAVFCNCGHDEAVAAIAEAEKGVG